jgi:aralkylamine N-acetyltransferase
MPKKAAGKKGITIRFVRKWPRRAILRLYAAGGWWGPADKVSSIGRIISGSFAFAVAVDEVSGEAVGMGRVLSDGVSDAYIQDVIVLPEYRGRRVGERIVASLRDHCLKKKIGWVGLVAESGTGRFYGKLGFKPLGGHTPMKHAGRKR